MATRTTPAPGEVACPDPAAHDELHGRSSAASAAAHLATQPKQNVLDADGKLSSSSAATSLKYARARDLPSFPSRGGVSSDQAGAAAMLAKDHKMEELWHPEQSAAGSRAALLAVKDGGHLNLWQPSASDAGHSAATMAMKNKNLSPQLDRGYTDIGRNNSLLAATKSQQLGRQRAGSTPQPPPPQYPDSRNSAKNALNAATVSSRNKRTADGWNSEANQAARIQNAHMSRDMFGASPPVEPEVAEQRHQAALHESAVAIAKKMFEVQRQSAQASETGSNFGAEAGHKRGASYESASDPRYMSLQETAQKLAQERLAKVDKDMEQDRYMEYYGYSKSPKKQRASVRGRGRQRASSEGQNQNLDDSDDEEQARRIRNQMGQLASAQTAVDNKKQRKEDRASVMAAAEKRVHDRMQAMDEKVFKETGKPSQAMMDEWEQKAREKAERDREERRQHPGKTHIGGGKYMDQSEIEAIAAARLKPTLDEITATAEARRARDAEMARDAELAETARMEQKMTSDNKREYEKAIAKQQKEYERANNAKVKAEFQRIRDMDKAAARKEKDERKAAQRKAKEERQAAERAEKQARQEREAAERKEREAQKAADKKEREEREAAAKKEREELAAAEKKAREDREAAERKEEEERKAADVAEAREKELEIEDETARAENANETARTVEPLETADNLEEEDQSRNVTGIAEPATGEYHTEDGVSPGTAEGKRPILEETPVSQPAAAGGEERILEETTASRPAPVEAGEGLFKGKTPAEPVTAEGEEQILQETTPARQGRVEDDVRSAETPSRPGTADGEERVFNEERNNQQGLNRNVSTASSSRGKRAAFAFGGVAALGAGIAAAVRINRGAKLPAEEASLDERSAYEGQTLQETGDNDHSGEHNLAGSSPQEERTRPDLERHISAIQDSSGESDSDSLGTSDDEEDDTRRKVAAPEIYQPTTTETPRATGPGEATSASQDFGTMTKAEADEGPKPFLSYTPIVETSRLGETTPVTKEADSPVSPLRPDEETREGTVADRDAPSAVLGSTSTSEKPASSITPVAETTSTSTPAVATKSRETQGSSSSPRKESKGVKGFFSKLSSKSRSKLQKNQSTSSPVTTTPTSTPAAATTTTSAPTETNPTSAPLEPTISHTAGADPISPPALDRETSASSFQRYNTQLDDLDNVSSSGAEEEDVIRGRGRESRTLDADTSKFTGAEQPISPTTEDEQFEEARDHFDEGLAPPSGVVGGSSKAESPSRGGKFQEEF